MKKLLKIIITFVVILSCYGCKQDKTTVDSEEEWKALFDPALYTSCKVTVLFDYNDMYETDVFNINNDIIVAVYDDYEKYYIYVDKENKQEVFYTEVGNGIYHKETYDFYDIDEADEYFGQYIANYSYGEDFSDYYSSVVYNKENKSYDFTYDEIEDIKMDVSIKVLNGRIIGVKEYVNYGEYSLGKDVTISFDDVIPNTLPDVKKTIDSKEEWASLFDENKYLNMSIYRQNYDGSDTYIEVDGDKLLYVLYFDDGTTDFIVSKVANEDKYITYTFDENGNYEKAETAYGIGTNNITYEQRRYRDTIGENYSNRYADVKYEDGYYVLTVRDDGEYKEIIKYEVSNGYIVTQIKEVYQKGEIVSYTETNYGDYGAIKIELPE